MRRCVNGFAFTDFSKGHSVYIIKIKQSKNGGARWLKSCVLKDLPIFGKKKKHGTTQPTTRRDTTE